jgi:hypothetical protein
VADAPRKPYLRRASCPEREDLALLKHQRSPLSCQGFQGIGSVPGVIGHYRLRPPKNTTTVRVEEDQIVKTEGARADTRESFRALYLLESDDHESVLELAARIPAARMGGAVEVWPLAER